MRVNVAAIRDARGSNFAPCGISLMHKYLGTLAFLLAPGVLASAQEPTNRQVELKKGDRILFFGDSLTQLGGQDAPKQHVTKGYVKLVQEALDQSHPDLGIKVDWVENWDGYHRLLGEVHCGTNATRKIPDVRWWETGR